MCHHFLALYILVSSPLPEDVDYTGMLGLSFCFKLIVKLANLSSLDGNHILVLIKA